MERYAAITGWGEYLPETILTNEQLAARIDTSDEWIRTRTGIRERRIAAPGESTSSMCITAAQRALECAELNGADLDLVICASTTPDHLLPPTACLVQERLGAAGAGSFDLNAACTGFLYGLVTGSQFIRAGTCERVLVVGGEALSRFVNWQDRRTCILFGDGAGAVVLEATEQECGVLSSVLGSRGDVDHLLAIEAGGSAKPATPATVEAGDHFLTMRGHEVFRFAVRSMTRAAGEALARADLAVSDLRMVIPHQANLRILKASQQALDLPWERFFINLDRYGNTGAASVPIALSEFLSGEAVQPGDNLLLVAFGGGLTWGAALVRCADVKAVIGRRGKERTPAKVALGKKVTFPVS
jgi:3-oxoacyl-[acyl-carrier-protein] synthase-3